MSKARYAEGSLSHFRLREVLVYEPATGLFWRKAGLWSKPGYVDGAKTKLGYIQHQVSGMRVFAHRLAWFYVHGEWPKGDIDHINGDPSDNRLANLRDVPRSLNMQNRRKASSCNKTGFLGVSPHGERFVAGLFVDGRRKYLGTFDTPEEAHRVYVEAKRRLHAGCTL